jgi:predicted ATPase
VISAEAAVDKLYFSGDYEFEFERTVSRLVEMQGKEYLQ